MRHFLKVIDSGDLGRKYSH